MQRLKEMLEMQKALNKAIKKKHHIKELNIDDVRIALFDELGETTHALKGDWCWWKKNQKDVDLNEILEELCDVLHFCLTIEELLGGDGSYNENIARLTANKFGLVQIMGFIINATSSVLTQFMALVYYLEFDLDDVYNMYLKKNKVNYDRLESGINVRTRSNGNVYR